MADSPIRVACVGEAMIELIPREIPGLAPANVAGDTLNTAIYLRRNLSDTHQVSYVTMLGQEQLSEKIISYIQSQNLLTQSISRHPTRNPGLYAIATTSDGERSFSYWRDQSAARCMFQSNDGISFKQLEAFDVIYLSGITLAILPENVRSALLDWLTVFRQKGGKFAFDSNYRPTLWESQAVARATTEQAWRHCDIALPSVDDEQDLFGETDDATVLKRFAGYTQCTGALKRSASGPVSINTTVDNDQSAFARAEHVVDTTAAGDSFSGAYIASFVEHNDVGKAMVCAHNQALKVVGHSGAIIPL